MKRIAVFYGHVASNIGDIAINQGEIRLLRQAFPAASLHFVQLDSEESQYLPLARSSWADEDVRLSFFQASYQKALAYQTNPAQFLRDCGAEDADLIILASGEHLFYYQHGENKKSLFWRILPALAAKAAGKHCIALPSTLGPFEDDSSWELIASLLDIVDGFAARDAASARLLTDQIDIKPQVLLDPAFFLEPPQPVADPEAERRKVLGLSMRSEGWGIRLSKETRRKATDHFTASQYKDSAAFEFSFALCEGYLRKGGTAVRIFVQTVADEALAESLRAALEQAGYADAVETYRPVSVDDYLLHISKVDFLVASRFHAIILALVAKVPAFGAYFEAHGHKMPGLFDLLGASQSCFNLSSTAPERAAQEILDAIPSSPSMVGAMQKKIIRLRKETVSWLKKVERKSADNHQFMRMLGSVGAFSSFLVQEGFKAATDKKVREIADENRKLSSRLKQIKTNKENLEQKLAQIQAQAYAKAEEDALRISAAERNLEQAEAERRKLERQLADTRKRLLEVQRDHEHTKKQLQRIRSSLLYQSGVEIVRSVKEPRKVLSLPFGLYSIYRETKKTRKLVTEVARSGGSATVHPSPDLEGDVETLLTRSSQEVIEQIRGTGASKKDTAWKLAQLSKVFCDRGRVDEGCQLAQAASDLMPSEGTYRALFWALQKAGRLEELRNVIDALEAFLGANPSAKQKERLQNLKSQSPYQLTLRELVVPKGDRQVPSVSGRICYVLHNSLPYSSGGYATRAQGVAKGLQSLGYEVISVTRPGFPIDIKTDLDPKSVPLTDIVDGIRHVRTLEPTRKIHTVQQFVPPAADVLEAYFRDLQPETVVAASNYICALPALIAARRLGINFIYEVRGFWEVTRMSREPSFSEHALYKIQEIMETFVCNNADKVLTLTGAMKEELIRRGVAGEKIGIAPNSCEPEFFFPRARDEELAAKLNIPNGIPVIGYVGTFVDYEGLDDLARACGLLKSKSVPFRLLLVGNEDVSGSGHGPIAQTITAIAAEYGFSDWLIMPGRVPHEEVASFYSLIDIAPFPRKPWPVCEMVSPMKPLEALAMEKAVVVSGVAALSEMIEDRNVGLVFEKGSVTALATALEELILSPDVREKLGKNGRDYVLAKRTWNRTAEIFADTIKALG